MEILLKPLVVCVWLFLHSFLLYRVARRNSGVESFAVWCMVCWGVVGAVICYILVTYYIFLFVR